MIKLPEPRFQSHVSLEEALSTRRSIREYADRSVTIHQVSQLLWSAYGITSSEGLRTAPSAMTAYPLEIFVLAAEVDGLEAGFYHYEVKGHSLLPQWMGDRRGPLYRCTFDQKSIPEAKAIVVFTAVYERTRAKLGDAGDSHVHMDVGHAGENLHLQAVALGLGTVVIGAFRPAEVTQTLELPAEMAPLYLMPVGYPLLSGEVHR